MEPTYWTICDDLRQKAARAGRLFVAAGVGVAVAMQRSGRNTVAAAPICGQYIGQMHR